MRRLRPLRVVPPNASMTPSTSRQNAQATSSSRMAMRSDPRHGLLGVEPAFGVGRRDAFERAARRLPLGAVGRQLDDLLPLRRRGLQILLAEREHDALVQQRLRVLRIDLQRLLELRERLVGLVACSSSSRRGRCWRRRSSDRARAPARTT